MVGQAAAGDAGNGRYARTLVAAMAATAGDGDTVASLVATPEGIRALEGYGPTRGVPSADVARLARAADLDVLVTGEAAFTLWDGVAYRLARRGEARAARAGSRPRS
jgi:hypothetical protein